MKLLDYMRGLVSSGKMDWAQLTYAERRELVGRYMAEDHERAAEMMGDALVNHAGKFGALLFDPDADAIDWRDDVARCLVADADRYMQDELADLFERAVYEERQARADSARDDAAERRRDAITNLDIGSAA